MDLHLASFIAEAFPQGTQGLTDHGFKAALALRGLSMGPDTRRQERAGGAWLVGLVQGGKSLEQKETKDAKEDGEGVARG